ncbi:DNA polymerase III subunit alpha [Microvirga sp. BT688]|uniref:DNA polymerase III subunit alpha n=1 Tax=Microvirga sp. TaxID=1873136 RepID=UPI001687803B|nr:DNA polymerase III subunit alpha [Microvirga sp.]MBD2745792.1 DNA polymerase III subunit alpha [Microvirga sp.]
MPNNIKTESYYSLGRSCLSPEAIVGLAKAAGQDSVGICDRASMAGAYEFCKAAKKAEIKPILGLSVEARIQGEEANTTLAGWVTLIARNEAGLKQLYKVASACHLGPVPLQTLLDGQAETLYFLTGPTEDGLLANAARSSNAGAYVKTLFSSLDTSGVTFAVEIERRDGRDPIEARMLELLNDAGLEPPVVATSEIRHASLEDREALEIVDFVSRRKRTSTAEALAEKGNIAQSVAFKSSPELEFLFKDVPQALTNADAIAARSDAFVHSSQPRIPHMPGLSADDEIEEIKQRAREGLKARIAQNPYMQERRQDYLDRLEFELDHITRLGFAGYFLIVSDFITWSKEHNIPVGPGRGSGAGSLVAWTLSITELDPLRFGLLFERFINPERVSLPDFDVDFCEARRQEVMNYVMDRYGEDRVAHIGAYITMGPRAAFKAAAASRGMTPGAVEAFSRLIPQGIGSLADAQDDPNIARALTNPELAEAFEAAKTLEGTVTHATKHAAGVVISDRPLLETAPLFPPGTDPLPVVQYEMGAAEATGHVKFDFLGLKTLTVIERARRLLEKQGISIDPYALPFEDEQTFTMLNRGWTLRVFQIESPGMTKALKEIKPTRFEDLIALVALYRPGPMEYIPLYGARKAGRAKVTYPHPKLEASLAETYGIIIYQEQIMQMARIVAGYSLAEADVLRKAIGKKIPEEIAKQRTIFVEKCIAQGESREDAEELYNFVLPFAAYGFNKSHAAAYALITWITAYLKRHHTHEFLAANMDQEMSGTDELARTVDEAKKLGIIVLPPDINVSGRSFQIERREDGSKVIRYALCALSGIGRDLAAEIAALRQEGPFRSLEDFTERTLGLINKTQIQSLILAGAFDRLPVQTADQFSAPKDNQARINLRAHHLSGAEPLRKQATSRKTAGVNQGDLFGSSAPMPLKITVEPLTVADAIAGEEKAFGYRFAAHPIDIYADMIGSNGIVSLTTARRTMREITPDQTALKVLVEIIAIQDRNADGKIITEVQVGDACSSMKARFGENVVPPILSKEPLIVVAELDWSRGSPVIARWSPANAEQQKAINAAVVRCFDQALAVQVLGEIRSRNALRAQATAGSRLFIAIGKNPPKETSLTIKTDDLSLKAIKAMKGVIGIEMTG